MRATSACCGGGRVERPRKAARTSFRRSQVRASGVAKDAGFFFFFLNTERTDWGSRNSRTGTGTDRVKQENGTRKTNTRGTQEERHNPKNKRPNPPPKQKRTAVRRGGRGKTHRNTHTRDTQLKPPPKQKKTADRRRGKKNTSHTLSKHTRSTQARRKKYLHPSRKGLQTGEEAN